MFETKFFFSFKASTFLEAELQKILKIIEGYFLNRSQVKNNEIKWQAVEKGQFVEQFNGH